MLSLFENNREMEDLHVFILANRISDENIGKLQSVADQFHRPFTVIDASDQVGRLVRSRAASYVNENTVTGNYVVYLRLFLKELLPSSVNNILYLDCDTLIVNSLGGMGKICVGNTKAAGMVCDCTQNDYKKLLKLQPDEPYFNSGVMWINLEQWEKLRCSERILDHMKHVRARYPLPDQDLINVVLHDNLSKIPLRYNYQTPYFMYPTYSSITRTYDLNEKNFYTREEFDKARDDYVVVHFSGSSFIRPWYSNSNHPLKNVYRDYLERSPWKGISLPAYQKRIDNRAREIMYKVLPPGLNGLLSGWILKKWIYRQYLSKNPRWKG